MGFGFFVFSKLTGRLCAGQLSTEQITQRKKKKKALEIRGLRGFMSQSWMMTIMSDSLFPRKHAQGSPERTCSF